MKHAGADARAVAVFAPGRARARRRCAWAVILVLVAGMGLAAQGTPRVEPVTFSPAEAAQLLARIRQGLMRDRELEAQYTYLEKRREVKLSKLGKVSLGNVRTFEVYPSIEPGRTYKRLVAVNDVPLPAAELARRDAAHRQRLEAEMKTLSGETPAQRGAREQRHAARMARQRREVDETFDSFRYTVEGREPLDGHARPLLRVAMTPRKEFRATSDNDFVKYAKKFKGYAWVDEADGQVVRIRLEAIEPLSLGWGIIGRVHKGSVAMFERRKVNGEVWLPWRARLDVTGRVALFRRFDIETETVWWDYKKFNVETTVTDVREP